MNDRVFYIKALGLIVIGGIVKSAVRSIATSISAPATIINQTFVQPASTEVSDLTVVPNNTDE